MPETLSNFPGKWIKKTTADYVEFSPREMTQAISRGKDSEKVNLKDLNYKSHEMLKAI